MSLNQYFKPIIINPRHTIEYSELMPSAKLQPYISCFWGSQSPYMTNGQGNTTVVIPDGCMDIIFQVDYITGSHDMFFCGIHDRFLLDVPFQGNQLKSIFGIRFYFWAVHLFANNHMREARNMVIDVDAYFGDFKKDLEGILFEKMTLKERVVVVEQYLSKLLYARHHKRYQEDRLMDAIYHILIHKGLVKAKDIGQEACISQRQLERLFLEYYGCSPKKIASIVRFQNLWQDIYYGRYHNIMDVVWDYRYHSQAHFINDFKRYFNDTPLKAMNKLGLMSKIS